MNQPKPPPISILISLSGDATKASARVRGFWIAQELEKLGYKCTLRWDHSKLGLLRLAHDIPPHDIIIFQKTYSRYHKWLMSYANALGKRTFLDIDDAPSRTGAKHTLQNVTAMMHRAEGVIVGSKKLYELVHPHQPNTQLIPSGIKLENYCTKDHDTSRSQICLGWIGNGSHYTQDLITILPGPLTALASRHDIRFKIVGACKVKDLYETFEPIPGLTIEFIDQVDWSNPDAVADATSDFDIGLYPLLENEFNIYKCGFKALEYMASGIPVVSSNIKANTELITDKVDGFIVNSNDDWTKALERLIEEPDLRIQMGQQGRRKVEQEFATNILAKRVAAIITGTVV